MPDLILVLGLGPGVGRGVLSWERSSMLARGASSSSSPASSLAMVTADYSSGHNISNLFTIIAPDVAESVIEQWAVEGR